MTTIVITGLEIEARIARRAGLRTVVISGKPQKRAAGIAQVIASGASGLISFGIAGGLDPKLAPGALLLPETVWTTEGQTFAVNEEWRRRLLAHIPGAVSGAIYGGDAVVSRVVDKRTLFRRTKAIAVDLESGLVARAATAAGIPFVVLRAVADPAHRNVPHAAVNGLNEEGRVDYGAVFGHLVRNIHQLPALFFVALETRRALAKMYTIAEPAPGFHAVPVKTYGK